MIILDLSQIYYSIVSTQIDFTGKTKTEISSDFMRHVLLNCIRSHRKKWKNDYGEIVIACDSHKSWRREIFPYYKIHRKKERQKINIDWKFIHTFLDEMKADLKEFFPYIVIEIEKAEADDVIATILYNYHDKEKNLILSGDKDFIQLHYLNNVDQYDPIKKRWIKNNNPHKYLTEHIVRGDVGDGIPNIRSLDESLAHNIRQKPITQKFLNSFLDFKTHLISQDVLRNMKRNKALIDLSEIPVSIKQKIIDEFENQSITKTRIGNSILSYFMEKGLKNLITDINDF